LSLPFALSARLSDKVYVTGEQVENANLIMNIVDIATVSVNTLYQKNAK